MMRIWPTATFIATLLLLCGGERHAAASTQATITIIMTTLGTDGAPASSSTTLPAGSTVTVTSTPGVCDDGPMVTPPDTAPTGPVETPNSPNPTGGTGNNPDIPIPPLPPIVDTPTDVPEVPNPDEPTIPDEPTVPEPPIVLPPIVDVPFPGDNPTDLPDVPLPDGVPPETTSGNGSPTETPEPATLTLGILGALGAAGWARRKRKAA